MSENGSDSDGVNPRVHEALDRKIKYTLETFERLIVRESNVEPVFRDGAVKLSYDEILTAGTKASLILQLWLATPHPSDSERARLANSEHQPAVQLMAVALQVLTADQLQEVAKSLVMPLDAVRTGGRMTVPAKRKVVLRCTWEAAEVDACMVAALDDATVERLYRRVAWKPIMQQLVDAIYPKNNTIVQSPSTADQPRAHSPRPTADRQDSATPCNLHLHNRQAKFHARTGLPQSGDQGHQRDADYQARQGVAALQRQSAQRGPLLTTDTEVLIDTGSAMLAQAGEANTTLEVLADLPTERD